MNFRAYTIMSLVPPLVLGFMTLVIPIRLVWEMKLNLASRVVITGVFAIGAVDLVISICRLVFILQGTHRTNIMCLYCDHAIHDID